MGCVIRWLKKLTTGRRGQEGLKENDYAVSDWRDGAEKEKRRWSFVNHRRNNGVDGGRRPSEAADTATATAAAGAEAEAATAEPSQVRPCRCGEVEDAGARRVKAAVVIQKAYRGYLARKALCALRSLVKLQAVVRGYLVRKQAATTLRRLQVLVRLQACSRAAARASYRKSMEQERISVREIRLKTAPGHRRRLSDSADSSYERSPRIVEMDTCHLRSRSSRMSIRHSRYHSSADCLALATAPPSCSPLSIKQPSRMSIQGRHHERDPRDAKTAHSTPRFGAPPFSSSSPAKSADGALGMPRRLSHRDALVSPRYMAGTASSAARTWCQSAPRQRQGAEPPPMTSTSLTRSGSTTSSSHTHALNSGSCFEELIDETARDYYLDTLW
ncbi:hypothetical protein GUJ93_ZPchr0001g31884 [Zizania palustris]|nr:hypothetical protein GUJ93_ZPchr0001g31884 [Zizania palustris]KAG8055475.1 hypothetical protein GUJ93_ZPchr0001g31884 [Zizania palustris]KAG8055476.1 hypothetical protein GUJ93_ZPchr0001g31884 [Zizania palustris]